MLSNAGNILKGIDTIFGLVSLCLIDENGGQCRSMRAHQQPRIEDYITTTTFLLLILVFNPKLWRSETQ